MKHSVYVCISTLYLYWRDKSKKSKQYEKMLMTSVKVIFYEKRKKSSETLQEALYCQEKMQGIWNFPKILLLVIEFIYTKAFWCD